MVCVVTGHVRELPTDFAMSVVLNGVVLSRSQAATLRSALVSFEWRMSEPGALGVDQHGMVMVEQYKTNLRDIFAILDQGVLQAPPSIDAVDAITIPK